MQPRDIIALVAVVVALSTFGWNSYTFHRNTKLALFKERFTVYSILQQLFANALEKEEDLTQEEIDKFKYGTSHAEFLFGPEISGHLNTIYNESLEVVSGTECLRHNEKQSTMIILDVIKQVNDPIRVKILTARLRLRELQFATNALFAGYLDMYNSPPWYVRVEMTMQRCLEIGDKFLKNV